MMSKQRIASAIKYEMGQRNLTFEDLVEMTSVSRSSVSRVLNPYKVNNVKYSTLMEITKALHIPIEEPPMAPDPDMIKVNYLRFYKEETDLYPIFTLSQLILYLPLILQNLNVFADAICRIGGDFYRPSSRYELDQFKRIYDSFKDSPMKDYADYLCLRATHNYDFLSGEEKDRVEMNYNQQGEAEYHRTLLRFYELSTEIQKVIDNIVFKDNS